MTTILYTSIYGSNDPTQGHPRFCDRPGCGGSQPPRADYTDR